jgi:hypothetical protein
MNNIITDIALLGLSWITGFVYAWHGRYMGHAAMLFLMGLGWVAVLCVDLKGM